MVMGALTCTTILVCILHLKMRQALMSLHECGLIKTEFYFLHPVMVWSLEWHPSALVTGHKLL